MVTLLRGVTVLPWMPKTDTVPSDRLATSASVPCRLMLTPAAPAPAWSVLITRGGVALRSTTDTLLSGICLVLSAGSICIAEVTRARPSSGVMATLRGGPTTLVGTGISATTLGPGALRSMIVMVSGAGFCTTWATPLTRATLLSLAEMASCASAGRARGERDCSERREEQPPKLEAPVASIHRDLLVEVRVTASAASGGTASPRIDHSPSLGPSKGSARFSERAMRPSMPRAHRHACPRPLNGRSRVVVPQAHGPGGAAFRSSRRGAPGRARAGSRAGSTPRRTGR